MTDNTPTIKPPVQPITTWDKLYPTLIDSFALIVLLVAGYLNIELKKKIDKSSKISVPSPVVDIIKQNLIYAHLGKLSLKAYADRLMIMQFHNGAKFTNGLSFMKFSTTYEVCAPGLSMLSTIYQSTPVTMLGEYIIRLAQKKIVFLNEDDIKNTIFNKNGIVKLVLYPIHENDNLLFFFAFGYTDNEIIIEESFFSIKDVKSYINIIFENLRSNT